MAARMGLPAAGHRRHLGEDGTDRLAHILRRLLRLRRLGDRLDQAGASGDGVSSLPHVDHL